MILCGKGWDLTLKKTTPVVRTFFLAGLDEKRKFFRVGRMKITLYFNMNVIITVNIMLTYEASRANHQNF